MKKTLGLVAASLILASVTVRAGESDGKALSDEAKGVIGGFFEQLKGELQGAMKDGGPIAAIGACNEKAPGIAQAASKDSGWTVARTSLGLRNPANAPDDWEKAVLQKFEERKAAGEDPKDIAFAEVVDMNGAKVFRLMKAIPTAELCLNCHGGDLKPEVAAKLDALYPADKARGYGIGDIRGAFTLKKTL